ncbi:hypothetical protein DFH09DRAFT_1340302 [Mycena vulgaris]|nr:hypothetical protein DFH09DRAFT_1340302 [Mycena vulgaris]
MLVQGEGGTNVGNSPNAFLHPPMLPTPEEAPMDYLHSPMALHHGAYQQHERSTDVSFLKLRYSFASAMVDQAHRQVNPPIAKAAEEEDDDDNSEKTATRSLATGGMARDTRPCSPSSLSASPGSQKPVHEEKYMIVCPHFGGGAAGPLSGQPRLMRGS